MSPINMTYELHPLCTLFPRLGAAEFAALCADIGTNGLRSPIVLHEGLILDGGNRYRACLEAGVEPTFTEFEGGNLWAFVWSMNGNRRHMTPGQQAAIVASGQDWAQAQKVGGDRKSDQSATLHLDSAEKRAAESGSSLRTQKMADKVAKADPALAKQVAHGEVSLPKALAQVEQKPTKVAPTKPKQAPALTAEQQADADALGDFDPLAELETLGKELETVRGELAVAMADDKAAEIVKWKRIADQAQRRQNELMDQVNQREQELTWMTRALRQIGKAVGEADPKKVLKAVENMAAQLQS
jgi:hypothetical protein